MKSGNFNLVHAVSLEGKCFLKFISSSFNTINICRLWARFPAQRQQPLEPFNWEQTIKLKLLNFRKYRGILYKVRLNLKGFQPRKTGTEVWCDQNLYNSVRLQDSKMDEETIHNLQGKQKEVSYIGKLNYLQEVVKVLYLLGWGFRGHKNTNSSSKLLWWFRQDRSLFLSRVRCKEARTVTVGPWDQEPSPLPSYSACYSVPDVHFV